MPPAVREMTGFVVRHAMGADASFILNAHQAEHVRPFLGAPTMAQIERSFRDPRPGLEQYIITCANEPVGLLLLEALESWLFEIRRILSLREGQGVGTFALRFALKRIFEDGSAHRAYLEVAARNRRARRLYERHGFILEGTWRDGWRDPVADRYEDLCAYGMLASEHRRLGELPAEM